MKKFPIFIIFSLVIFFSVNAQSPQGFNYQAALRNAEGQIIANQSVEVLITLTNADGTTEFFKESHSVNTGINGVISLPVGFGNVVSGTLTNIPWGQTEVFIKTEVKLQGQNQYMDLGQTRVLSVPIALFAASGNQGPQGEPGPQGPAGIDGRTILSGTVNPSNEQGQNGDFYINTTTNMLFGPKAGGIWPAGVSLVGPQGLSIEWLGTFPNPPANPTINQAYYNSSLKKSFVFNGSSWQIMAQDGADAVAAVTGTGTTGKIAVWNSPSSLTNLQSLDVNPNVAVISNPTAGDSDPIFEVKNKNGQVVFAVYQQGVRVYVADDGAKAPKGGFAVGGIGNNKGDDTLYMKVTPDSVKIMFKENAAKSTKGGFLVGGLSTGKGAYDLLKVTPDLTRIYFDTTATKSSKGGFAVGGLGTNKSNDNYMELTQANYLIGYEAGKNITTGRYNCFMGYQAGTANQTGSYNVFLGYNAGKANLSSFNTFLGYKSGSLNTTGNYNSFMGYNSGASNTTGSSNVFIGNECGKNNSVGFSNVMIGDKAGFSNISGQNNITIGQYAGYSLTSGKHNTLIGTNAGYNHTTQEYNVMIGTSAGYNINATGWNGSFNTFIGINSGYAIRNSRDNTFIGTNAGYFLDNGSGNTFVGIDAGRSGDDPFPWVPRPYNAYNNTFVGCKAGYHITQGNNNIAIGYLAGYNNQNGSGNVFIGNEAGFYETGNNKLYINNSASNPLIYGDFSSKKIGINTQTLTSTLNVGGDLTVSGNISATNVSANLTGNVTGNVSGSAGNIGGVKLGKIFLWGDGTVISTANGNIILSKSGTQLRLTNNTGDFVHLWWQAQQGSTQVGFSIVVNNPIGSYYDLTNFTANGQGMEIHFGKEDGSTYCSVWLQYSNGRVFGHYMMY